MRTLPAWKPPRGLARRLGWGRREVRSTLSQVVRLDGESGLSGDAAKVLATTNTATGCVRLLRVLDQWTLPVTEHAPEGSGTGATTLILSDGGIATAGDLVERARGQNERAVVVDLLFMGECVVAERGPGHYGQMIGTVGRRPLGIQVAQLGAVVNWIEKQQRPRRLRAITNGPVAGLAALVYAALHPGRFDTLEMRDMIASLKDLLAKNVGYGQAPSMFCFGLLQTADVHELIELARPTKVTLAETK